MNHITFKDKEGFDINVLAFDGESNFAILDRTSTGSPTPYVVVKGSHTLACQPCSYDSIPCCHCILKIQIICTGTYAVRYPYESNV